MSEQVKKKYSKYSTGPTPVTLDTIINLSSEEFTHFLMTQPGWLPKDLLLMITRFENDVLEKIKAKDGEKSDRFIFYKRVLDIMYIALQAEENINFLRKVAIRAKMGEEFHRETAAMYYDELTRYKVIEEVINNGDLDTYIQQVKERNKK